MLVEMRPLDSVRPYDQNPRKNDQAVAAVARSLREFGFRQPIVVDEAGVIVVGHTRWKAAKSIGMDAIPVHVAEGMTAEQARAYRIADNQLSNLSSWDDGLLRLEAAELKTLGVDLDVLGFEAADLASLLAPPGGGLTDPDAVPEAPKEPVTKAGDVWVLGSHRLMCGDSTKAEDVARLMSGARAMLCFTSPPYAQQRDYTAEGKTKVSDWNALMLGVFANLPMSDDGQILVNLGLIHNDGEWNPYWEHWLGWMREQGWRRFGWYVWDQGFGLPGDWNGRLAPSHEFVFHFNKASVRPDKCVEKMPENVKPRNKGESTMRGKDGKTKAFTNPEASAQTHKIPDSVIRIGRQVGSDGHPAQFPVNFPKFVMQAWPGDVYEPFSGSGTTIIAAEQLGRACYAMEIAPVYVDIAVTRWEQFTGKKAERVSDGQKGSGPESEQHPQTKGNAPGGSNVRRAKPTTRSA